jgi:glucans biosynthesis protein
MIMPEREVRRFLVDFTGEGLKAIPADADVKAVITVKGAEVAEQQVQKNPVTEGWRLRLDLGLQKKGTLEKVLPEAIKGKTPIELRAFLTKGDEVLTETWSYLVEVQ